MISSHVELIFGLECCDELDLDVWCPRHGCGSHPSIMGGTERCIPTMRSGTTVSVVCEDLDAKRLKTQQNATTAKLSVAQITHSELLSHSRLTRVTAQRLSRFSHTGRHKLLSSPQLKQTFAECLLVGGLRLTACRRPRTPLPRWLEAAAVRFHQTFACGQKAHAIGLAQAQYGNCVFPLLR